MKREYAPIDELKKTFGQNKIIPQDYEVFILKALSHYPELNDTHIEFKLKDSHPVPYGTSPTVTSMLAPASKRRFVISILEKADPPTEKALFKNLPDEAKLGVLGHELGHVLDMSKQNIPGLLKTALSYTNESETRKIERNADVSAIEHGLGFELYTHARYIRTIPGYTELRKEIDMNYLHPNEILESLSPEELREPHL